MPQTWQLITKKFSEGGEWRWTYSCSLIFNELVIKYCTITDYYRKHLPHGVSRQIIKSLVKRLHGREMEPRAKHGKRDIYVWEWVPGEGKSYRLIFWFKDGTADHLWIRNCYPC